MSAASLRIVKDDSKCVPSSAETLTYPMAHVHPIMPAHAPRGPMMDRKHHGVALTKGNNRRPRLHSWSLLRQDEFASREVLPGPRQQHRDLQRKCEIAVEVLMQAI